MWFRKREMPADLPMRVPEHIGIIMDGNGRWAKRRGLPRKAGHAAGAQTFRTIVRACEKRGVRCVTVYAFSTENWRRPSEEVDAIMDLFRDYLKEAYADFQNENIRTVFLGDRTPLAPDIIDLMNEAEETTAHKTGMVLQIAINYGGRDEIVHAVRRIAKEVQAGTLNPDAIGENTISERLYNPTVPDPDLILRPSGEYRTSNFLLWQSAYAEYVFMDILWPDFTEKDLDTAFAEYARRDRRFGGV